MSESESLPSARDIALRRAADVKPVPNGPNAPEPPRPATPVDRIPDARTRRRESIEQTWNRLIPYLDPEVVRRLGRLRQLERVSIRMRIVKAERRLEDIATTPQTPSPKQRRQALRSEPE